MYPVAKINMIKDKMVQAHDTIAVAESVTSGHLQAALSQAEGAAQFYQGGITVYNLGQKARHLLVEPIEAEACNCVGGSIAIQMARQVTRLFTSDYGIGITGYAAPMPEKNITQLHAFYAIVYKGQLAAQGRVGTTLADALQVQLFYVEHVLDKLLQVVEEASATAGTPGKNA